MREFALQVLPILFVITWVGGGIALFFRARIKQNAYLRRVEREIDFSVGDPVFFPGSIRGYRDAVRVMRERPANPELETLRREFRRRFGYYLVWVFGFPVVIVGILVPLILTGVLR